MRVLGRYSPLTMATYPSPFGGPLGLLLSVPFLTGLICGSVGRVGIFGGLRHGVRHGVRLLRLADRGLPHRTNRVPVYQYLISITGVASGIVFFGQVLGAEKIVCGAVTLVGVYLARRQ